MLIVIDPRYLLIIARAGSLFFRRDNARYEGDPMILGSNPVYTERGKVLRDLASIELLMECV
ncbi:MAG: hypothetical protein WCA56_13605 [Xanthobacteraceae bacterium]